MLKKMCKFNAKEDVIILCQNPEYLSQNQNLNLNKDAFITTKIWCKRLCQKAQIVTRNVPDPSPEEKKTKKIIDFAD